MKVHLPFNSPETLFQFLLSTLQRVSSNEQEGYLGVLIVAVLCGIVYTFFGKKTYNAMLYTTGFLAGAVAGHTIYELLPLAKNPHYAYWIFLGIGGAIGVLIVFKLAQVALFLIGGVGFLLLAHPLLLVMNEQAALVVLLFVFVAGGFLALYLKDFMLVIATATAGSYLLTFSFFAIAVFLKFLQTKQAFPVFYIAWVLLGFIGLLAQIRDAKEEKKAKK